MLTLLSFIGLDTAAKKAATVTDQKFYIDDGTILHFVN